MEKNLTIIKPSAIAKFETKKKRYEALLSYPEVVDALNEIDRVIVSASLKTTISEIEDSELVQTIAALVEFVCKDLGISQVNDKTEMEYSATRFLGMLKRHYKDLTISDIKLAFELLEVGDLDPYLPKNRNGNPDREHYQQFNLKFYTKVLSAYNKLKIRVWGKAQSAYGLLEAKALNIPTKEEREYYHKETVKDIYKAFYDYKNNSIPPEFTMSLFIKEFVSAGLFELPKPSKEQIKSAYTKTISDSSIDKHEKKTIVDGFKIGNIHNKVMTSAKIDTYNQVIQDYFDAIIKSGVDIKEVIK